MSTLYHLRIDVRRIQDYIFHVPKLKYMLGANSKIGELLEQDLPNMMGIPECLLPLEGLDAELVEMFKRNIISSSGGHFEALFKDKETMTNLLRSFENYVVKELPDLEWSGFLREFDPNITWGEFKKLEIRPLNGTTGVLFPDSPFFQICANDGMSTAVGFEKEKGVPLGLKSKLMLEQADKFYKLKSVDGLAKFLLETGVTSGMLADTLEQLAARGCSLKRNMLAYIKLDGNGTGERFRKMSKDIDNTNVLSAFAAIEKFWKDNRGNIRTALKEVLTGELISNYESGVRPYLPLMLGGDDLFIVCVPEIALDLVAKLVSGLPGTCPASAGVAFTKTNYPIGLAARLAESCLESAKAASYRQDSGSKPSFIDWHVHFDSVYQDIEDIRRSSYMLEYKGKDGDMVELLTARPYSLADLDGLLKEVKKVAKDLDRPEKERANNKIKGFRSVLKDGTAEADYFRKMIVGNDEELNSLFGKHETLGKITNKTVIKNKALDIIELIEFYRQPKEGGDHEKDPN
ncbi:MAG TPA: hypothetical protein PK046_02400 [Candidatus Syntrophosphaera sp.]|jgi:hypothetical protein|nr:hypothetical protein [Candidatus Syntrophosphaera sp.]HPW38152.1 hypothetical protein [Candidatus Syntrophosphaera sp.]HQC46539.1 hypothetical protein [Candidatus Syntrophosphaera sp.]